MHLRNASFLLLAALATAQEMRVHVYRHGEELDEDPVLKAQPFRDRVEIYDAFTGQLLDSHEATVFQHLYHDAEIFWPAQPENLHRKFLSMAYLFDTQAWIFLGVRARPLDGDWERVLVSEDQDRLLEIGREIVAVDRDDPGEATLRREKIGSELISRLAAAPLDDCAEVASLYATQIGLTSGERYLVLRTYGWALFIYNDPEGMRRARLFYERAIELKPDWGSGYYNLALVEKKLDNRDAALRCLLAAHRNSPSSKYLKKLIDEVTLYGQTESLSIVDLRDLLDLVRELDSDAPSFDAIDERFPQLQYPR